MAGKAEYGIGHPTFIEYTDFVVNHKNYEGMPDLYTDKGHIQWEAPSNRKSGKYKDTHQKRREWWRKKAEEMGIDPNSSEWISNTAKRLHPTGKKPCKRCGRVMDIQYAYPSQRLIRRVGNIEYIDDMLQLDPLEHITDLITRMITIYGNRIFSDLPQLLRVGKISPPQLGTNLPKWLDWIREFYIPNEPVTLSPGAMSNAPDRLDGFHSFNLCCRSEADKGRHIDNLRSYVTDRRVFEYWNEGDWIAADRLMGEIRANLRHETCLNGHPGPCSADHVGPLSLGFTHRPDFQVLCASCNSAKNNRMSLADVAHLLRAEQSGEVVTSWYSKALWDMLKHSVTDDETALRLSKLLRDNRHTALDLLRRFIEEKRYIFLTSLLSLPAADFGVEFINLRIESHITHYDKVIYTPRQSRYAVEQKARRVRIALESLLDYFRKDNRNAFIISMDAIETEIGAALSSLRQLPDEINQLDKEIGVLLTSQVGESADTAFRDIVQRVPPQDLEEFKLARARMMNVMHLAATELANMWDDERYVRALPDIEE